ncbi:AI-2E family transporter [Streptococcus cuniculipharyngis]|uniref:AI-2E family transporter n=1 Tax=Streptococcus cuniculipharyngis TaxID=1562651 RepID=A0A5C5SCW7_9STRE|nr:AI-2E family transporter [Streptococcus cuniculipharyngis]TWS98927.1 AI-2E family transporter [Streptococcus cuniculipharyngis]
MTFNKSRFLFVVLTFSACYAIMTYWKVGESLLGTLYQSLSPFLTGAGIAYIVNIVMSNYETLLLKLFKKPIKGQRGLSLLLAYLTFAFVFFVIFSIVLPDLIASLQRLLAINPSDIQKILDDIQNNDYVAKVVDYLGGEAEISKQISSYSRQISNQFLGILSNVVSSVSSFASGLISVFVSFVFSIYILASKEDLGRQINLLIDTYLGRFSTKFHYIRQTLHQSFSRFFIGQTLEAMILGSLTTLGMLMFKLPYAPTIGIVIAFTALIPVVGAYIGVAIGTILIMTQSINQAIFFVVYIVILQQFEGNLIYPRVVGGSIGLPGMWVLLSITVGGALAGILGMLVAVPIAASLYKLLKDHIAKRQGHLN